MKTVSYKLAKKLKELGFKGATAHYWIKPRGCRVGLYKGRKLGFIESDFEEDRKEYAFTFTMTLSDSNGYYTPEQFLWLIQNGYALSDEWFTNGIAVEAEK